jgi:hypothetical protein
MIGDGQIDRQHAHDRANQPFALAQSQSENCSQSQNGFNGEIGINDLPAGVFRGCALQPANTSGVNQTVGLPRIRSDAL